MKTKFLSAILLGGLLAASTGTFVSCKDYDDDINELWDALDKKASTDELKSQLATLESSLAAAKTEAQSALQTANDAVTAANAAKQEAQNALDKANAANDAAGVAKAAADQAQASADAASAEAESKAAQAKIEAIEEAQAKVDALKIELEALINSKASESDFLALQQKVTNLENTALNVIGHRLTSVTVVPDTHINGIAAIVLKTVKYTPQVYQAIVNHGTALNENHSSDPKLDHVAITGASAVTISTDKNEARYQVSPNLGVRKQDIKLPSFESIVSTNTTRSATGISENTIIQPTDYDIDKNVLTVKFKKVAKNELNPTTEAHGTNSNTEQFYMASLKVPIAEDNLNSEEKEAGNPVYVNSEYTRIQEDIVVPYLANTATDFTQAISGKYAAETQIKSNGDTIFVHYHDSICVYESEANKYVDYQFDYSQPVDLKTLVTVCTVSEEDAANNTHASHQVLTNYADYGLEFRFVLPSTPYITLGGSENNSNRTDQQKFASIDDAKNGILTSKVYTVGAGGTSATAVGREPIVRVVLIDTNNNNALVAQRYLKIKWTKTPDVVNAIDLGTIDFGTSAYSCAGIDNVIATQEMNEKIYNKVKTGGMTKSEFHSIYTQIQKISGDGTISDIRNSEPSVDSYNVKWSLSHADIGSIWSAQNEKQYSIKFKYVDPTGVNGDVVLTLTQTVTMPTLGINGHQEAYWVDRTWNVFKVNPFVYQTPNKNGTDISNPTCNIYTDLKNGFVLNGDKVAYLEDIVKGYTCNDVQIIFDEDRLPQFAAQYGYTTASLSADKKTLSINGDVAAFIDSLNIAYPDNSTTTSYDWIQLKETTAYNAAVGQAVAAPAAIKLVGKDVPVKIVADLCGDGLNTKVVKSYQVHFIDPLQVNAELDGNFEDAVISGSRIGLDNAFTFTDWNGYIVAKTAIAGATAEKQKYAAQLYGYYEVEDAVWDTNNVTTNLKVDNDGNIIVADDSENYKSGKLPTNVTIIYDATSNELVYYNQSGTPVLNDYKVYIPVSVKHKWGVAVAIVEAVVKGAAGSGN